MNPISYNRPGMDNRFEYEVNDLLGRICHPEQLTDVANPYQSTGEPVSLIEVPAEKISHIAAVCRRSIYPLWVRVSHSKWWEWVTLGLFIAKIILGIAGISLLRLVKYCFLKGEKRYRRAVESCFKNRVPVRQGGWRIPSYRMKWFIFDFDESS